jgi:hypothetical protein
MRKAKEIISIISLLLIVDFVFFELKLLNPKSSFDLSSMIYQSILFILILILLLTFTYGNIFSLRGNPLLTTVILLLLISTAYFVSGRLRFVALAYEKEFSQRVKQRADKNLNIFDSQMNWRGRPNATGYYHYSIGDSIFGKSEVIFDSLGNRSVPKNLLVHSDTVDLFIGCSYTFGHMVKGEEGYPYLVTKSINHGLMNASMGAYGLAQMQMRLDSLLPIHRYRYVFIQVSPWLAERSMDFSGIYARGYPPTHYFSQEDGEIKVMPLAYRFVDFRSIEEWQGQKRSYMDRLRFLATNGFTLQVSGYARMRIAWVKSKMGLIPKPIKDKLALERHFYDRAIAEVRRQGAIPILVRINLNDTDKTFSELKKHLEGKALIIDCEPRLDSVANAMGRKKSDLYHIYDEKNGKKIYYDNHPNAFANQVIAEEILSRFREAR